MKTRLNLPGAFLNTNLNLHGSIVASQALQRHTNRHLPHLYKTNHSVSSKLIVSAGLLAILLFFVSCSVSKQIAKQANNILLNDSAISTGHIGISIYDVAADKYLYNLDANKYFVPASNTKLFSLYAGMKYLGDSLPALRYEIDADDNLRIQPTGDPTFLHPEFSQPVFSFLSKYQHITYTNMLFTDNFLGHGWAWDDHKESYMVKRSNFPMYGNLITINKKGKGISINPPNQKYLLSEYTNLENGFDVIKHWDSNILTITEGTNPKLYVPFSPNPLDLLEMLQDTLHVTVLPDLDDTSKLKNLLYSQPVDSLFKPMMHRSDNFYAEQTLLMASNQFLGYMDEEKMIDTLLQTDLKDIPQRPKWVDGSGLSRYNLFTPASFIYILNKLQHEFGLERIKTILPTGGEGTLSAYYNKDAGYIFAKTGTLSNHCALSGFLVTKKNRLVIFSVLVNHYSTGAMPVRKAVEKFIAGLRDKY